MRQVNRFLPVIAVASLAFGCNRPVATNPNDKPVTEAALSGKSDPHVEQPKPKACGSNPADMPGPVSPIANKTENAQTSLKSAQGLDSSTVPKAYIPFQGEWTVASIHVGTTRVAVNLSPTPNATVPLAQTGTLVDNKPQEIVVRVTGK